MLKVIFQVHLTQDIKPERNIMLHECPNKSETQTNVLNAMINPIMKERKYIAI